MGAIIKRVAAYPLGSRSLPSSATLRRTRVLYDYALADIGLLSATSKESPLTRQTAPFRKEQFDSSANPGEQTLTNWWLRSQSTFHEGTGIRFMEPASDETVMNAFAHSVGVNPWVTGEMTLLKEAVLKKSATSDVLVMGGMDGTTDVFYHAAGTALSRETAGATAAVTWGGAGTIVSLANDGDRYLAADATGIYRGTMAGGVGALYFNTGNANVTIGWAKQRLVAGIGASVYELTGAGPALPAALYTHPSSAWRWTAVTEGSSAIFVAGYSGTESAIYKFVLSTAGVMPTLTSGIVAAKMPYGEQVHSMHAYVGTYVVIGTNKGVRIGTVTDTGDINYGPLIIESTSPVRGLVGKDRFVFATCSNQIDTKSGLWRIDLGGERQDGTFPYATDLNSGVTGTVNSVAILGASGRMVFGVSNSGSYLESASVLVATGYFRTGYVRFNTVEPKQFRYITCRVGGTSGSVGVESYDANATITPIASFSGTNTDDFDLGRVASEEYLAIKFTLNRSGVDSTLGPILQSWQIKALPATRRSRLIEVPFLLFEEMRDSKGAAVPPTNVQDTLGRLEELESTAAPILFSELCESPVRTELVIVEQVRYQQVSPPARCKGNGGIVYLTLRTVQ